MGQGNVKRLLIHLHSISSNNTSLIYRLSDYSGPTDEGMKELSIFLSQDGIVLEELDLSLKEKKDCIFTSNRRNKIWRSRLCSSCWRIEKEQNSEEIEYWKYFFKQHFSDFIILQVVESLLKEWKQFPIFFPKMELFLRNWIWVWKKKKNNTFQHQTGFNIFRDEGCVHLVEGLKQNKTVKKLNIGSIFS